MGIEGRTTPDVVERLFGALLAHDSVAQRVLPAALLDGARVQGVLEASTHQWLPDSAPQIAPIWVLAAGWGSGSTLVQRLLMSSGRAVIWGEPLDRAVPIPHLAAPLVALEQDWPPASHFRPGRSARELADAWVANLVPPMGALREAQRAWLRGWLEQPVHTLPDAQDITTFGMKEVRLSAGYAYFLKWLFPASKIIFVVRHPYDCWRSCKGVDWYSVWPRHRVARRLAFAHHWRHLSTSFLAQAERLDALLLPYESLLAQGKGIATLERYAALGPLDRSVLGERIGGRGAKRSLGPLERRLIAGVCAEPMRRLGYGL